MPLSALFCALLRALSLEVKIAFIIAQKEII